MWSWFGGAAAQKRKDAPKTAILQLRGTLDMLQKREKHLETQIAEQDAAARKYVNTNKPAAKNALRRKKALEKNLESTTGQIIQLEQQVYSIEAANINNETLQAMKQAGAAMEQIHSGLTIDTVDKEMDKLREQHALAEEINIAMSTNQFSEVADEEDLDAELEGLEQEAMDERMLNTGPVPVNSQLDRLPAVGTSDLSKDKAPAVEEDDEEAELAKLRAEMAI